MRQGPAAALMQVWMFDAVALDGGGDVTAAEVADDALRAAGATQPKQTPMRHPDGMSTPASSPASRIGLSPVASTDVPFSVKRDRAALAGDQRGQPELLGEQRQAALGRGAASSASSSPPGPQARVVRSSRSGTKDVRSATSRTPCWSS